MLMSFNTKIRSAKTRLSDVDFHFYDFPTQPKETELTSNNFRTEADWLLAVTASLSSLSTVSTDILLLCELLWPWMFPIALLSEIKTTHRSQSASGSVPVCVRMKSKF